MGWSGSRCVPVVSVVTSRIYNPALGSPSKVAGKRKTSLKAPLVVLMNILAQPPTPSMQQQDPYIPAPERRGRKRAIHLCTQARAKRIIHAI